MIWVQFIVCTLFVVVVGSRLSFYGDAIAEKSGLGQVLVGAVLIGAATPLPELATGLSAVVFLKSPDLAGGGIFGSCLFNLTIIAVADMAYKNGPVLSSISRGQLLSAILSVVLMVVAAFSLLASHWINQPSILGLQVSSLFILSLYLLGYKLILSRERKNFESKDIYSHMKPFKAYGAFFSLAALMIALSVWLAFLGEGIAQITGWGESFVGTLFLAFVTSLPELVVSYTAVKLGAPDLAIGNVFGSNVFNISILVFYDLAFPGNFWGSLSLVHLLALMAAISMTGVALMAILFPRRRPLTFVSWESLLIIGLYLLTVRFLFQLRGIK